MKKEQEHTFEGIDSGALRLWKVCDGFYCEPMRTYDIWETIPSADDVRLLRRR
jgi:hypothetical protein